MALVVKEIIALPGAAIEERFTLDPGMGATIEVYGAVTRGMAGYGFIYTNRESLSVGIGALISQFMETRITPWDLLEGFKAHPMVAPLLRGGVVREYLAHAIPEGGLRAMPRLFDDGVLVVGDAAMMVNNLHREGSNMAMAAGRMAGETAIQAKRAGDWSARSLSRYRESERADQSPARLAWIAVSPAIRPAAMAMLLPSRWRLLTIIAASPTTSTPSSKRRGIARSPPSGIAWARYSRTTPPRSRGATMGWALNPSSRSHGVIRVSMNCEMSAPMPTDSVSR